MIPKIGNERTRLATTAFPVYRYVLLSRQSYLRFVRHRRNRYFELRAILGCSLNSVVKNIFCETLWPVHVTDNGATFFQQREKSASMRRVSANKCVVDRAANRLQAPCQCSTVQRVRRTAVNAFRCSSNMCNNLRTMFPHAAYVACRNVSIEGVRANRGVGEARCVTTLPGLRLSCRMATAFLLRCRPNYRRLSISHRFAD